MIRHLWIGLIALCFTFASCSPGDDEVVKVTLEIESRSNQGFLRDPLSIPGFERPHYSAPTSFDGFDCLTMNIAGPGINPSFHDDPLFHQFDSALAGSHCVYAGITAPLVPLGDSADVVLELFVPSGSQRIIQVIGAMIDSGTCDQTTPHSLLGPESGLELYEVGRSIRDLFADQDIEITNAFNAASPLAFTDCEGAGGSGTDIYKFTPFENLGLPDPSSMGDIAFNTENIDPTSYSATTPIVANKLDIQGAPVGNPPGQGFRIFIVAKELVFQSASLLHVNGGPGGNGSGSTGGNGGPGASGGGGGGSLNGTPSVISGGGGGTGGDGVQGSTLGGVAGPTGIGNQSGYITTNLTDFGIPSGGNGGDGGLNGGSAGSGVVGGGGGGGGGGLPISASTAAAGGGGGGGGLLILLADKIIGNGSDVHAMGGVGGNATADADGGGGGGGGVIWIAARQYDGGLTADVNGGTGGTATGAGTNGPPGSTGTAQIFQITDTGLVSKNFTDSW